MPKKPAEAALLFHRGRARGAYARRGWGVGATAVGDNGVILGTHDRGLTWYTVQPSLTSQPLRGVWRLSAALANAAGAAGVTLRTAAAADSATWQLGNAGSLYDLRAVCFPTAGVGYVVGYNLAGAVLRSDDGGASWQPQVANTGSRLKEESFKALKLRSPGHRIVVADNLDRGGSGEGLKRIV